MPSFMELAEPITARDIRRFDQEAKDLVADFQEAGWRGYLSNQGHAIMLAPDGTTTASVSGHSGGPHLAKWARADLKKWQRAQKKKTSQDKAGELSGNGAAKNGHATPAQSHPGVERTDDVERPFRCTHPDCKDRPGFVGPGPAILHRLRVHDGLVCKDCGMEFPIKPGSAKAYSVHRQTEHGGKPPKKSGSLLPAEDGRFHCEWCGRPFDTPQGRAGHRKTHKSEPGWPARPTTPPVWSRPLTDAEQAELDRGTIVDPADLAFDSAEAQPEPEPPAKPASPAELADVEPAEPTPAELADVEPAEPTPAEPSSALDDLDAWIAGQDPTKLLTTVLAVIAPPLVGEIERLRTERDGLRTQVTELQRLVGEHQARLALFREALEA